MTAVAHPGPATLATEDPAGAHRRALFRLVGLSIAVACALTRAAVAIEPFPHWDGDPTILYTPITSLGPSASLALDILTLLACALALLGVNDYRRRSAWLTLLTISAGAAAIAYHGLVHAGGSLDDLRLGTTWLAAFVTGATAHQVCRHEQLRRLALAASFAVIAMLAAKGIGQVLNEHPQTLEMFQKNREQFFASQGWAPDSPSALAFERRLRQNEATGWFGLSNVFASIAACTSVGLAGLTISVFAGRLSKRKDSASALPSWVPLGLATGALLAVISLLVAGSKGGYTAAMLGVGILLLFTIGKRRAARWATARVASTASLAVVGLSLLAVVFRGLLGERLGELSLFFRWFYMQGAARITAHHPLWGVGPAAFKDAYMLYKPFLSPEEVTSPHSILLDYVSTLGIAGVLLGVLWLAWVWGLGPALVRHQSEDNELPASTPDQHQLPFRQELRALFLVACAPTLIGAYVESQAATVEGGLIRVAGLVGTVLVAATIAATLRQRPALVGSLAAGAVALAAHAQIEVTPVTPGAACWFMLAFGALAAPARESPATAAGPLQRPVTRISPSLIAAIPAALILTAIALSVGGLAPAWHWESGLRHGAEAAHTATRFRDRLSALNDGQPDPDDSLETLSADLAVALGHPVSPSSSGAAVALRELQVMQADRALEDLTEASKAWPTHPDTLRAASKLALQIADSLRLQGNIETALQYADRAEKLALESAALPHGAAASSAWLGTVRDARARSFGDRDALERAIPAWETAARLDPRGLSSPVQLARALDLLDRPQEARAWARRALELNKYTRLDPLKGLSQEQKARLEALAR